MFRDRIIDFRRVKASELLPSPRNWRVHNEVQRGAVAELLAQLGYVDAVIARQLADGRLELIDGHLRAGMDPNQKIPTLITDLDEEEAGLALATLDPVAELADVDGVKLRELLATIDVESEGLSLLLEELGREAETNGKPTQLRPLAIKPPPVMTWVLLGIPTVRFGEIAADVERLAGLEGVILESTSNDGPKSR